MHHGHHGHHGKIEGDLQSLISQLSAASSTDATSTTASTTSSTGTDSALATLEKSYDALLTQNGATSTSSDSLTAFLQALSKNLQGAPATGNVLTTQA